MAETSRSQVTITLGRSGQVVKKASGDLDSAYLNSHTVGRKRSIHDRLGTNVELNNKRHRKVDNGSATSYSDGVDDLHLCKDDLRYKILQKSGSKQSQNDVQENGVDLREILSRSARPSTSSLGMQHIMPKEKNGRQYSPDRNEVRQVTPELRDVGQYIPEAREVRLRMPETRDFRERIPEAMGVRQQISETRDARQRMPKAREVRDRMPEIREVREIRQRMPEVREIRQRMPEVREIRPRMPEVREIRPRMPEVREIRQRMPEVREIRQRMPDAREIRERMPETRGNRQRMTDLRDDRQQIPRQCMPDVRDDRQHLLEPAGSSMMGRIPSTRDIDVMPQIDSLRNSYFPWALDHRRRLPDGDFSSRGTSLLRNVDESRRRPIISAYDDVGRSTENLGKDGLEFARPMRTASYMEKQAVVAGPPKPVAHMLAAPPSSSVIADKSSYTVEEQQTVEGMLHSLGLGKYIINFKAEEVDMHALRQMGDNDLKELGIPMGPRKTILLALLPRSRRKM